MLKPFEYLRPASLEEALTMLKTHEGSCRLIAGGTDVILQIRSKREAPKYLVSLKYLTDALGVLEETTDGLHIGALATHRQIEKSILIKKKYSALHDGVSQVGSVQVRNVATLGGNLCSSVPSADSAAPLLVLGARLIIAGDNEETLDMNNFFIGPHKNILKPTQILRTIWIPGLPQGAGSAYEKLGRRKAMEIPLVGAAAYILVDKSTGTCIAARIALASSAPTPIRCYKAESVLIGQPAAGDFFQKAGHAAAQEANPWTDFRSTEDYRRSVIPSMVKRALVKALARIDQ